jgi:hypothetical protein
VILPVKLFRMWLVIRFQWMCAALEFVLLQAHSRILITEFGMFHLLHLLWHGVAFGFTTRTR